jgi:hypothetical protein
MQLADSIQLHADLASMGAARWLVAPLASGRQLFQPLQQQGRVEGLVEHARHHHIAHGRKCVGMLGGMAGDEDGGDLVVLRVA